MPRPPRYVPPGGALVEVTCRTIQGRLLLRPFPGLREILVGVLSRANELYPVKVCAYAFLSNHYHLLIWVPDAKRLSDFMGYVNCNISKKVGREIGWKGKLWSGRYHSVVVSDEPEAQIARLHYILSQGVKEGLVACPLDWPGLHAAAALLSGKEEEEGWWVDHSAQSKVRWRKGLCGDEPFRRVRKLALHPLPCWREIPAGRRRALVRRLIESVRENGILQARYMRLQPLGVEAILGQDPMRRTDFCSRRPRPLFHAASRAARSKLHEAFDLFLEAFRTASQKMREQELRIRFPDGSFPPAPPFVAAEPASPAMGAEDVRV